MAESFFQRWSRRKAEQADGDRPGDDHVRAEANPSSALTSGASADGLREEPLPSLDDVARLSRDSDYSMFVSKGVDSNVRRAAMKKLFADPHFNAMDGLDIYIDDYTKPSPLSAAMLAALKHTQPLFEAVAKTEREREEREEKFRKAQLEETPSDSVDVPDENSLREAAESGTAEQRDESHACDSEQAQSESEACMQEGGTMPDQASQTGTSRRHGE